MLALWLMMAAVDGNWPSFRGPGATGVADGMTPPVSWDVVSGRNVLWKTPIPGLAHSSPVVWGDRVFVTTAVSSDPAPVFKPGLYGAGEPANDNSKQTWRVLCIDRKSGKVLWDKVAYEGKPRIQRHPKSTHASATPATNGEVVVATFGSEGLFAFDMEGKLLWKRDLGTIDAGAFDVPEFQWGNASSPILHRDTVIVQGDGQKNSFIAAFDQKSGKPVWRTGREALPSWSSPTVVGDELIANGTKHVRGYDARTGKELWQIEGTSMISVPTPFAANGLIFVFSGYRRFIQPMYAIRPGGKGEIAWRTERGAPYLPTPIVVGDHLYAVQINGTLACYRAGTGERLYEQRLGEQGGAYSASPVAADGRIYFTSEDGDVFVLKAGPAYELLATNKMGETCMATPAISKNMLLYRTRHHLIALGQK